MAFKKFNRAESYEPVSKEELVKLAKDQTQKILTDQNLPVPPELRDKRS